MISEFSYDEFELCKLSQNHEKSEIVPKFNLFERNCDYDELALTMDYDMTCDFPLSELILPDSK